MSKVKLSILIRTIPERLNNLKDLLASLYVQMLDEVEILISCDKGIKTRGQKAGELLDAAVGDYVCFIDDDDKVPPYYIAEIMNAIKTMPDCVGIKGEIVVNGSRKYFLNSLSVEDIHEEGDWYYRFANHLNPVKRGLALMAMFDPEIDHGEDTNYARRLKPFMNKEVMVDKVMYYYSPA